MGTVPTYTVDVLWSDSSHDLERVTSSDGTVKYYLTIYGFINETRIRVLYRADDQQAYIHDPHDTLIDWPDMGISDTVWKTIESVLAKEHTDDQATEAHVGRTNV